MKEKAMIRIILVALTIVLYLIFSIPVLAVLKFRAQRTLWECRKRVSAGFRRYSASY